MSPAREPLTFEVLDDREVAHERSRPPAVRLQPGPSLGALIELLRFCDEHPGALGAVVQLASRYTCDETIIDRGMIESRRRQR
jgi:hypothetical protein